MNKVGVNDKSPSVLAPKFSFYLLSDLVSYWSFHLLNWLEQTRTTYNSNSLTGWGSNSDERPGIGQYLPRSDNLDEKKRTDCRFFKLIDLIRRKITREGHGQIQFHLKNVDNATDTLFATVRQTPKYRTTDKNLLADLDHAISI